MILLGNNFNNVDKLRKSANDDEIVDRRFKQFFGNTAAPDYYFILKFVFVYAFWNGHLASMILVIDSSMLLHSFSSFCVQDERTDTQFICLKSVRYRDVFSNGRAKFSINQHVFVFRVFFFFSFFSFIYIKRMAAD